MSANNAVSAVLTHVNRELDSSLDRLFALLRIQSISTDPAYAAQCRKAAEHVAADLGSLGFDTSLRPTAGHPVVIGNSGNGVNPRPRVCDTGMWDTETPSITTSLRGLVYEEVRLTCADRDLHSGLFGGAARNPIHVLADIISALHRPDGSVAIAGFYDGVPELPADIRADLAGLDLTPEKFLAPIGLKIPAGEKDRILIEQISTRPTAEVNGIISGYTGEGAKTVIPGKAMAKVSFRLVGAQDPDKIRLAFREFVRARVPADCTVEFGNFSSAPAFNVAFDNPALAKAREALAQEWGKKAVTVGAGGSIPIVSDFKTVLGMDTLMVGFALDDDRVHSPNEKYDLKCFHKGIRSWVRILAALAAA